MPVKIATYNDVRQLLQPGDVIAFAGDNALSEAIMKLGKADVSHVGIIVAAATTAAEATFIESTIRVNGSAPTFVATITPFPDRLSEYRGEVWWLSETLRLQALADRRFGDGSRADALLDEAEALARKQGAQLIVARIAASR